MHADSAGVDIARTGNMDHGLTWRFEPVRVLGGDEPGEQSFFAAVDGLVGADAAGDLYVLDNDAHRVVVFDSTGEFVRAMGREGGAPDEFRMVLGFSVSADGTANLFDFGKRGIMRFGPDAQVLDVVSVPTDYRGGAFHLESGVLTIPRQLQGEAGPISVLSRIAGSDTSRLAGLPAMQGRPIELASCGMAFSGMAPMFTPTLRWTTRGPRTAVATAAEYDVLVLEGSALIRRIRREITPTTATTALAVQDVGPGMQVRTEGGVRRCDPLEVVEQRGIADVMPAVSRLALDPAGRLWVERGHVRGETAPIDVFDADGDYLGTLPAGTPFPVAFLSPGRLVSIDVDDLDVSRLVIHRIDGEHVMR
jgi:hypothetical protein